MNTETPKSDAPASPPVVTQDDAKRVVEETPRGLRAGNDAPPLPNGVMARREVLPLNSGIKRVKPGETIQITSRPQRSAFRPERFFVSSHAPSESAPLFVVAPLPKRPWWKFWARRPDPQVHQLTQAIAALHLELSIARKQGGTSTGGASDWEINDITIGNRSQFAQAGSLPGDMFASTAIDSFVTFDTALTAMDVVVTATYRGSNKEGASFSGAMIGTSAVFEYQH